MDFREHCYSIPFWERKETDFQLQHIGYENHTDSFSNALMRIQHFYSIYIVCNGSGTLTIQNKSFRISNRMIFFIPPHVKFRYCPDPDSRWNAVWFEFTGNSADVYLTDLGLSLKTPVVPCRHYEHVFSIIQKMFESYATTQHLSYYEALSVFYRILDTNAMNPAGSRKDIVQLVQEYILTHYNKQSLTAESIAEYFQINHSHLCRLFKQQCGTTIKRYLILPGINGRSRSYNRSQSNCTTGGKLRSFTRRL